MVRSWISLPQFAQLLLLDYFATVNNRVSFHGTMFLDRIMFWICPISFQDLRKNIKYSKLALSEYPVHSVIS